MLKGMVISDTHHPFQDDVAIDLMLGFLKEYQPDVLYLNGDIIDFYAISNFVKLDSSSLRKEIDSVKLFLHQIRRVYDGKIIYIQGNYEMRLQKYIGTQARELMELDELHIESLLDLDKFKIEYIPSANRTAFTMVEHNGINVGVGHYNKVSKFALYTAKALVHDLGINIIQGHTHRGGIYTERKADERYIYGIESYCLCDLNADYVTAPNWAQGFITFIIDDDYYPRIHQIKKGRLW